MSSAVWLTSLSIMHSKPIHVAAKGKIFTFYGWVKFLSLSFSTHTRTHTHTHIFFIHSSAHGHLEMHFVLMFTSGGWAEVGWESFTQSLRDAGWWLFPGSPWGLSLSLPEGRGGLQRCMYEKFTWSRPMSGFDFHPYSSAKSQSQGHASLQEKVRNTCLPQKNTC